MRVTPIICLFAGAFLIGAKPTETSSSAAEQIVAAEHAFAAAVKSDGLAKAFYDHAADDGIIFQPGPTSAKQLFKQQPSGPGLLEWWPTYAGASRSGDLGFATGPYVFTLGDRKMHGQTLSVWRRQSDGNWRWVLDHGVRIKTPAGEGRSSAVHYLAADTEAQIGSASASLAEVKAIEMELARGLAVDASAALQRHLAPEGRVMREPMGSAIGHVAYRQALEAEPASVKTSFVGGGASRAGDLVYTYGSAAWVADGETGKGNYVRIWHRQKNRWVLLIDEIAPVPPQPGA